MAGTIVVDRIESDASYASTINVAGQITFSNTVNFGAFAGTAPVAGFYLPTTNNLAFTTASTERMRIDSSGNVGIGTSSPDHPLTVKKSFAADWVAKFTNQSATGVSGFGYYDNSDTWKGYVGYDNGTANFLKLYATTSVGIIFLANATEAMRITSDGKLGVNTGGAAYGGTVFRLGVNDTNYCIAVNATAGGTTDMIDFYSSGTFAGKVSSSGATTAYNTSSDYRLKEDITPLTGALTKVSALKPVTFKWKLDGNSGEGFIAHELAEVCPYAVNGEKDEVDADGNIRAQSIDTSFLVATLTAAIQEQQALITTLTARITALETSAVTPPTGTQA